MNLFLGTSASALHFQMYLMDWCSGTRHVGLLQLKVPVGRTSATVSDHDKGPLIYQMVDQLYIYIYIYIYIYTHTHTYIHTHTHTTHTYTRAVNRYFFNRD